MASILVIGSASLDILHIQKKTYNTIGGAGLYTALAARVAGAQVTLFAPKPDPMPEIFREVVEQIHWLGPTCDLAQLPRLEIAHHGDGKATLLDASWGATANLSDIGLPSDLSNYDFVHIAALPTAMHQLEFLQTCRQRKAKAVSCGTYAKLAYNETEDVRKLAAATDLFFLNENEANGLFGSNGPIPENTQQVVFVTLDRDGVMVIRPNEKITVMGNAVEEVDPTGAGDTFCGTTLARLANGDTLTAAAEYGCRQAALTVQSIGPQALLGHSLPDIFPPMSF